MVCDAMYPGVPHMLALCEVTLDECGQYLHRSILHVRGTVLYWHTCAVFKRVMKYNKERKNKERRLYETFKDTE